MQFELPSRGDVTKCVVTKETVEKNLKPTLVTEGAKAAQSRKRAAAQARAAELSSARSRRSSALTRPGARLDPPLAWVICLTVGAGVCATRGRRGPVRRGPDAN